MTRALLEQALELIEGANWPRLNGRQEGILATAIRAHLAQPNGEPIGKVFTRKVFHEYEGSEKQDTVGYWVHDYFWFKRPEVEGTTYLYTHPAHLAKTDTAPAWHDAPTGPGLWLCNLDMQAYHLPDPEIDLGGGNSWFGPINEDSGGKP